MRRQFSTWLESENYQIRSITDSNEKKYQLKSDVSFDKALDIN